MVGDSGDEEDNETLRLLGPGDSQAFDLQLYAQATHPVMMSRGKLLCDCWTRQLLIDAWLMGLKADSPKRILMACSFLMLAVFTPPLLFNRESVCRFLSPIRHKVCLK